ncbi:MAG: hypothetical protein M1827_007391 [Pycnora praestabilis]|nr:MAG: hypothetical protein M1827_007391 [Pycnora praestabilis]
MRSKAPFLLSSLGLISEQGAQQPTVALPFNESRKPRSVIPSEPDHPLWPETGRRASITSITSLVQSQKPIVNLNTNASKRQGFTPLRHKGARQREQKRYQETARKRSLPKRAQTMSVKSESPKGQYTLTKDPVEPSFGVDGAADEGLKAMAHRSFGVSRGRARNRGSFGMRRTPQQEQSFDVSGPLPSFRHSSHRFTRPLPQPRGRSTLRPNDDWATWVEVSVRVYGLPPTITTLEIWRLFSQEGKIDSVEIFENAKGVRDGGCKLRFRPPPASAFWQDEQYPIVVEGSGRKMTLRVELDLQRRSFFHSSPVNPQISFPEWTALNAESLRFGFMFDPSTMMAMHTVQAGKDTNVSFALNLLRREIEVQFRMRYESSNEGQKVLVDPSSESSVADRIVNLRFRVPLAQIQTIHKVQLGSKRLGIVFSLDSPPNFYRQVYQVEVTHDDKATFWSEWDTWYRQTDIVYDPKELKSASITLKKTKPIIDIGKQVSSLAVRDRFELLSRLGRWTTYHFVVDLSNDGQSKYDIISNALQDYNINIIPFDGFKMITTKEPAVWDYIDKSTFKINSSGSFEADMTEPAVPLLSFLVRYQLEACISQGCLNEHNLTKAFVDRLAAMEVGNARDILEYVAEQNKRIFDPMSIFDIKVIKGSASRKIPHYCAYSRAATITPSTVYFNTPTIETSNRVVRQYVEHADRFLRVRFKDEKYQGRINATDKHHMNEIFTRIKRTMKNGITIGDRHFEFLAFGNSQFREHGAYFFAPTPHLQAEDIRAWMGYFNDIKVIAKHAARLGQCFSTTRAINGTRVEVRETADIVRSGYTFSDGVSKISKFLAQLIASELDLSTTSEDPPSVFQFRLGGCKGVLAVSPDARMREMFIRPSQYKSPAVHNGLEIIRWSQFASATLNRQIILVLSTLGVPDEVFVAKLKEQLSGLETAMTNETMAMHLLQKHIDPNQMTITIAGMLLEGFMKSRDPFVTSLLHLWRAWSIKYLKEHAKIVIEQGAFLLGCVDETATLKGHFNHLKRHPGASEAERRAALPEIFVQISDQEHKGRYIVITGICLLARNPSLHPGDIRVVNAIDVPALHHLRDVVVLPQTGDRDVSSMCSGGDLDGDDYLVMWDKDLNPSEWNHEPMDYTPPKPQHLDREVTVDDITSFFVTYMKNDRLPQIAHAHLATADYMDDGVKDHRCLSLANLHSKAVDYVKTGESASMPKELRVRKWPHFMEKQYVPKEQVYVSSKVLGQLFDLVERVDFVPQFEDPFDKRILEAYNLDEEILRTAFAVKEQYDAAMRRIMAQHKIHTEFEVWSTFVLHHAKLSRDYKLHEEMSHISGSLKDRFRLICQGKAGGKDFEMLGPFVAAMYAVTHRQMAAALEQCRSKKLVEGKEVYIRRMEAKSMPLLSFPWLFPSILGKIANGTLKGKAGDASNKLPATENTKRTTPQKAEATVKLPAEDVLETAEGITHRGELLELFHHGDQAVRSNEGNMGVQIAPNGPVMNVPIPDGQSESGITFEGLEELEIDVHIPQLHENSLMGGEELSGADDSGFDADVTMSNQSSSNVSQHRSSPENAETVDEFNLVFDLPNGPAPGGRVSPFTVMTGEYTQELMDVLGTTSRSDKLNGTGTNDRSNSDSDGTQVSTSSSSREETPQSSSEGSLIVLSNTPSTISAAEHRDEDDGLEQAVVEELISLDIVETGDSALEALARMVG